MKDERNRLTVESYHVFSCLYAPSSADVGNGNDQASSNYYSYFPLYYKKVFNHISPTKTAAANSYKTVAVPTRAWRDHHRRLRARMHWKNTSELNTLNTGFSEK